MKNYLLILPILLIFGCTLSNDELDDESLEENAFDLYKNTTWILDYKINDIINQDGSSTGTSLNFKFIYFIGNDFIENIMYEYVSGIDTWSCRNKSTYDITNQFQEDYGGTEQRWRKISDVTANTIFLSYYTSKEDSSGTINAKIVFESNQIMKIYVADLDGSFDGVNSEPVGVYEFLEEGKSTFSTEKSRICD